MIDSIVGIIEETAPGRLVIGVGAFCLNISVPLMLSSAVKKGSTIKLFTHLVIKDDKISIIGFSDSRQRKIFLAIQKTPKVGPKTALTILSALSTGQLLDAVENADVSALSAIPKIGKKTAERILFELKGLKAIESDKNALSPTLTDAVNVLVSLGCDRSKSEKAVTKIAQEQKNIDLETLIKTALSSL
ncbi:MAG: Holliday junction ATP-dependent DNA helicase RuvA [bacterium]|nr:MAG: Holliday junction ATP-dependent DNA helicase RuvA [bacterium]